MRIDQLPALERVAVWGGNIRIEAATLISMVEINATRGDGGIDSATKARDFFVACAQACHKAAGATGTVGIVTDAGK